MGDIHINFGGRPRPRRRRRRALGIGGGLAALAAALVVAFSARNAAPAPSRLPAAAAALERLRALAPDWSQIPAAVVDQGPLRNVPYLSYRAGDLEFNAYGDPERPLGLEIGVYGDAARRPAARDALAALVGLDLGGLDLAKDKRVLDGLTCEITPETAPDAYGGWWVSVYDAKAVEEGRASDGEIKGLIRPRPIDVQIRRPGRSVYVPSFRRIGRIYSIR